MANRSGLAKGPRSDWSSYQRRIVSHLPFANSTTDTTASWLFLFFLLCGMHKAQAAD